ncbi:hypothetical protein DFH27DRAFT_217031 [Peziza echinospora]|nr:hypothetical protein DFH27DRAFT_217031 [Peziza echinospora]
MIYDTYFLPTYPTYLPLRGITVYLLLIIKLFVWIDRYLSFSLSFFLIFHLLMFFMMCGLWVCGLYSRSVDFNFRGDGEGYRWRERTGYTFNVCKYMNLLLVLLQMLCYI